MSKETIQGENIQTAESSQPAGLVSFTDVEVVRFDDTPAATKTN